MLPLLNLFLYKKYTPIFKNRIARLLNNVIQHNFISNFFLNCDMLPVFLPTNAFISSMCPKFTRVVFNRVEINNLFRVNLLMYKNKSYLLHLGYRC